MQKKILTFIVNNKKILALYGKPHPKHGKGWFAVTGEVEKNESYEQAVKREILKETGLVTEKIISLNWGSIYNWNNNICEELNYLAFVKSGKMKLNGEHKKYEWLSFTEFLSKIVWGGNKMELKRILQNALNSSVVSWKIIDDLVNHQRIVYNKGSKYIIKWFLDDDFSKINRKKVTQVYCIAFNNNGNIIIVDVRRKNNWSLPGGSIEGNEYYGEALRRECMEEADMEILDIKPLGYNLVNETDKHGNEKEYYQLRYLTRIGKFHKQTIDVATGVIPVRKLINPSDFAFYCPWGFQGDEMIQEAVKRL